MVKDRDMNYLYHFVPPNMVGHTLYPSSVLENIHPEVAEFHRRKYINRPTLPFERIPTLNCLWKDVIFLSPVIPQNTAEAFKSCGIELRKRRFFRIDPRKIEPSLATIWLADGGSRSPETFIPFDPEVLGRYSQIPERTLKYYRSMVAEGRRREILVYALVPHVLFKGTIDVSDAEIIVI